VLTEGGKIMKTFKQNITYNLNGQKIKIQFDFCPRCKHFEVCYDGAFAHYISPECIDDFESGKFD
jgi:hypothetical protein